MSKLTGKRITHDSGDRDKDIVEFQAEPGSPEHAEILAMCEKVLNSIGGKPVQLGIVSLMVVASQLAVESGYPLELLIEGATSNYEEALRVSMQNAKGGN